MISISCLESKLLNNNNWYGRFQLAPFQKGEGLTVANALRRTLLAEKRAFFITWVDFYNAEIPYSVLTGMRESIFDILLNLKQVTFTSDKILPNNNHFLKMRSDNSFKAQKIKRSCEPLLLNQSINRVLPITKQKRISRTLKLQNIKTKKRPHQETKISCFPAEPFNKLKHSHVNNLNQKRLTTQNVVCENQILGKIINSKNETSLRIFHKNSDFTNQLLDSRFSVTSQNGLKVPKKMSDSTYIGYICAKGPATIYAKNIKLPKGLKCVDPDKYITTLADDGLFYLRFALTTKIQAPSLTDTSNISNRINQGIKFNRVNVRVFPKTLLNKEIQSRFNRKTDLLVFDQEKRSRKKHGSYKESAPVGDFKQWPVHYTNNLINQQCLLLTNDTIKQFNFQNTSMIANIQKTCLLNIQIKHYYYKCGRFDRFLFDLIKPFKPNLISTQYKKPCLKNNKQIFSQESDRKVLTHFQKIFERQKSNSYLLIDSQRNNLKKAFSLKKKHFMPGSARADKLSNRFSLQSYVKSFKLESQTPNTNIFETYLSGFAYSFIKSNLTGWKLKGFYEHVRSHFAFDSLKWQKIFKSLRTNSIYNYLQKLNTSQARRIYCLLTNSSPESKILLLGSQLILNNDSQAKLVSTTLASILKNRYLKSDVFSLDDLWLKENIEKQTSQFLFREFVGPPVNKLVGGLPIQKNSDLRITNQQTYNNSSIFTLYELYIKKFLNVCFLFQCSKNHILYFLRFYILQNNLPGYRDRTNFLNHRVADSVHLKNILHYSPFKSGRIYTEKLITKIRFLRQWSFLDFKYKKQTNILLLNEKTGYRESTSVFSWVKDSLLMRQKKSPQGRELLYLNQSKTSKYDIHLREFFYSKNNLPIVISPLFNLLNDRPKKTDYLSTLKKNQPNRGYQCLNSVQISTNLNLRAKPSISIQQVSYQPVCIFPYQVEKNTDKLLLWFNHLNLGSPKQNLTNNNVILKPIYLNIEQIIYILQQTTKFRKNQRINPVFFNSLTRLKNKKRYPLDYSSLFSKISTRTDSCSFLDNSFYKPYFFNNMVRPDFGFHFFDFLKKQTRSGFFFKNTVFYKNKINERKTIGPYFIDAKTQISNTDYTQKPLYSHVRILGNDFVFKMAPPENQCLAFHVFGRVRSLANRAYTGKETRLFFKQVALFYRKNRGAAAFLRPFNELDGEIMPSNSLNGKITEKKKQMFLETDSELGLRTRNQFLIDYGFLNTTREKKQLVSYSSNMNKDLNRFVLASSLFSNYFPLLTRKYKSKLKSLSNEPYNINICHSIICFNLRYTYPFKSTIFETRLPFLNFFKNLPPHLKTSKKIRYRLKNSDLVFLETTKQNNFFSVQGSKISTGYHNFDYIQYNESFKIYTSLAYTCLKTYEPHLPKYHNFNRRNQKRFQNNGPKVMAFQLFNAVQRVGWRDKSLIQDWAVSQAPPVDLLQVSFGTKETKYAKRWGKTAKNKNWISNTKNETSYYEKYNACPSLSKGHQLPSILNSASKWRIMNTSDFNDAFIISPCTWFLNFQLYGSRNSTPAGNLFYSFVTPLQKLFYMNYTAQNQSENEFFKSFGAKKEIIKNKLHWLKTTRITNESSWLRSYIGKKNLYKVNSKNFAKENTDNFVNPSTNLRVPKEASFLNTFEQNSGFNFPEPIISQFSQGRIKRSIKKLAINFENIYYKNLLWNSRKITLRILTNAVLPLVTNRKYSISNFLPRKNYQATTFLNMPISFSLSSKFANRFIWGFKQKIRPYLSVFESDAWSHKNFDNIVLKSGKKNWLDQSDFFNEFYYRANLQERIYHDEKLSFYSLRHKTLGTTNFMCSKIYPPFINENETQNNFNSNSSIEIPKESEFENNFSYTSAYPFYNDKMKTLSSTLFHRKIEEFSTRLKKKKYLSNLIFPLKPISRGEINNEWYTQKFNDFFSESFSSLGSKWKPFFMGSLRYSQEKTTSLGLPVIDFATQPKQLTENNENRFKIKSPLMHNLWSSLFFCRYSLYAISTRSDLFFQNLINNDKAPSENWTPSTNKIETSQINSRNYINNLHNSVRVDQREENRKLFFPPGAEAPPENSLINSRVNNKMQLPDKQNNSNQFLNVKPSLKLYYETIQKILKYYDHKLTNYIALNYDYYWQKAIHSIILSRFHRSKSAFAGNLRSGIKFNNGDKNLNINSFFLQYPKRNLHYTSQSSISKFTNRYSIRRLINSERYFGNPLRRHLSQNGLNFGHILLPIKFSSGAFYQKLRNLKFQKSNQQLKSWKSIIYTVNANLYFCFRYPLFIQNCNSPWQKSKHVFGMQKNWLNRIKVNLKRLSPINSSTYLSKRPYWKTENMNVVANSKLMMTYTQLSSSSNKTHQFFLHNKSWTNTILSINLDLQNKGSYGMIGYFTIKESLNLIYKVNYIVESQDSESKSMSELAFHSAGSRSASAFLNHQKGGRVPTFDSSKNRDTSLTRNPNQSDRSLKPENSIENFQNMKTFDNIQRDSVNTDALTVSNFLNGTYSFIPSKTIILNSFNELTNFQINRSEVENENEYIQIDIWTNGELSPREALLNAFRKLFELFYNLSKYNCLKPIEI